MLVYINFFQHDFDVDMSLRVCLNHSRFCQPRPVLSKDFSMKTTDVPGWIWSNIRLETVAQQAGRAIRYITYFHESLQINLR